MQGSIGLIVALVFLAACIGFFLIRVMSKNRPATTGRPTAARALTPAKAPDLNVFSDEQLLEEAAIRLKRQAEDEHRRKVTAEISAIARERMTPVPSAFSPTSNPNPAMNPPAPPVPSAAPADPESPATK